MSDAATGYSVLALIPNEESHPSAKQDANEAKQMAGTNGNN
jgi:hypothetical protein